MFFISITVCALSFPLALTVDTEESKPAAEDRSGVWEDPMASTAITMNTKWKSNGKAKPAFIDHDKAIEPEMGPKALAIDPRAILFEAGIYYGTVM